MKTSGLSSHKNILVFEEYFLNKTSNELCIIIRLLGSSVSNLFSKAYSETNNIENEYLEDIVNEYIFEHQNQLQNNSCDKQNENTYEYEKEENYVIVLHSIY